MAVKATHQVDIVDLTDGVSVNLSSDSVSLAGNTSGKLAAATDVTTTVQAFIGGVPAPCTVALNSITCSPSGYVTAKSVGSGDTPLVTLTVTTNCTNQAVVTIPVVVTDLGVTINKTFSVSIAKTGSTPAAPYNYILGVGSITIPCDKDGQTLSSSSVTVPFSGCQGTTRNAATATISGLPTGITTGTNTAATASADGSFVLSIAASSTLGDASSGTISVAIKVNNATTFNAKITWAKSITGADGIQGGTGAAGAAATNIICGNESAVIACNKDGATSSQQTITIPFSGWVGNSRAACSVAVSGQPSGITVGTNTAATTSADGSLTLTVANNSNLGNAATKNGEFTLTFSCNSKSFVKKFTWVKALDGQTGQQGPQGPQGDDAIMLTIDSSAGYIFKNTQAATTLTARVFQGGTELTGSALSALGTIKWYKDGGSTAVGTGASLVISAGDVTNHASYTANLEA